MIRLLITLLFCWNLASLLHADQRPNVLILFMDDQQADTIAGLGNRHIQTPNLDKLVRRGLSFDRAYMQGGMHGATCVPSRAMLLSGRSLFRVDEKLLRDETWPAAFARAGYSTFITGKWHNGEASLPVAFQEARSIFAGGMTNPLKARLAHLVDGKLAQQYQVSQHACAVFADEAVAYLQRRHEKPFLCYVAFDGPHDPHIVPDDYALRYDPAQLPVPVNFLPQHPWNNGEMTVRDEKLLPWPREPQQVQAMLAEYYRYISYLDQQIGRILDQLAASPHARNTIIVFAADSGVARGQHGLIGKQNCYEHSLRVPLILAGPGVPVAQRTRALCYLHDVLPTLGQMCHVTAPSTSEGQSFTATLNDPTQAHRTQLVMGYRRVQRTIIGDRWKLIRYPLVDRTQLFDLTTDPMETTNLAGRPEQAERLQTMLQQMKLELTALGDTAPLSVDPPQSAAWSPPKQERK